LNENLDSFIAFNSQTKTLAGVSYSKKTVKIKVFAFDGFETSTDYAIFYVEFKESSQQNAFWLDVKDNFGNTNAFTINLDSIMSKKITLKH
jgi:hypothetical protein